MPSIVTPENGILFMKVGTHAQESLEDIIARKTKEIEEAGYALWGYGGNTCHPTRMVQPFARAYKKRGGTIYLCMQPMESKHFAEPVRASKSSSDGINWEEIPGPINVRGSRYALAIKSLHKEDFELPLSNTRVAIGTSTGRCGADYIAGRVDKACLEFAEQPVDGNDAEPVHIGLVAELVEPFAVFLRN